jgi:hypothetical protein
MPSPLPIPARALTAVLLTLVLAGCQIGSAPRSVPTVPQIGGDLKCPSGDHGFEDQQMGWGFCYPNTWRYVEKIQATDAPAGVDLTFDITCLSDCKPNCPSPAADQPSAQCLPQDGLFGYMIISTDDRRQAADLAGWVRSNLPTATLADPFDWGNAVEAVQLADGRKLALTPHNVVILDVHMSNLDVAGEMGSRLDTWKFSY